ncbi:MAG: hypothetical protein R8M38_01645 [Mariprofundaceae bacterium]
MPMARCPAVVESYETKIKKPTWLSTHSCMVCNALNKLVVTKKEVEVDCGYVE